MITVQEILESQRFKDLLSEIRIDVFQEWSDAKNVEDREDIYKDLAALDRLEETLMSKMLETTQ